LVKCLSSLLLLAAAVNATIYFVDDSSGLDTHDGRSQGTAWQGLAPVNSTPLVPGDTVRFRRGGSWTGGLFVSRSGRDGGPIVYGAYGDGPAPTLRNPGTNWENCIDVRAGWVVVESLRCEQTFEAGVNLREESHHAVVRQCEMTNTGFGVWCGGHDSRVVGNYIHDLNMINNTEGGDDDYGACGVVVSGAGHELCYNVMENCIAPSYDYEYDGGVGEVWSTPDAPVTDCYVHHNRGVGCDGFFEIGGQQNTAVHRIVMAYNVSVNNRCFGGFHMGGTFGVDVRDFRIENNTVIEKRTDRDGVVVWFNNGEPDTGQVIFRNNIVCAENLWEVFTHDGFTHDHNLYSLTNTDAGVVLGDGELLGDPMFADTGNGDYHLLQESDAIDAGTGLGYSTDFEGNTVPWGLLPDLGAYEYRGDSHSVRQEGMRADQVLRAGPSFCLDLAGRIVPLLIGFSAKGAAGCRVIINGQGGARTAAVLNSIPLLPHGNR
jgi:hypothetical protein